MYTLGFRRRFDLAATRRLARLVLKPRPVRTRAIRNSEAQSILKWTHRALEHYDLCRRHREDARRSQSSIRYATLICERGVMVAMCLKGKKQMYVMQAFFPKYGLSLSQTMSTDPRDNLGSESKFTPSEDEDNVGCGAEVCLVLRMYRGIL